MNISNVFSTQQRVKILQRIILSQDALSVNRIADELNVSKALVSKYFDILVKEKVLKRHKSKYVVLNNISTKAIKILLNLRQFDLRLFRKHNFIRAVGMYGSCAKGTNDEASDIDLWIVVDDVQDTELAKVANELSTRYKNVKALFLNDKKIQEIKKKDQLFYHSLYFGSIILYGKEDEI